MKTLKDIKVYSDSWGFKSIICNSKCGECMLKMRGSFVLQSDVRSGSVCYRRYKYLLKAEKIKEILK